MNTGIAQLVALTAHGNAALQRPGSGAALDDSPLFQHVANLTFGSAPESTEHPYARVSEWFDSFRARGITRTRFVRLRSENRALSGPDLSAFANGEQSALAAIHGDGAMELWAPDWQSVEGQQGWTLTYRGRHAGLWNEQWNGPPVDAMSRHLEQILRDIADFASKQDLENWVSNFDDARELLTGSEIPDVMGLLPASGYSSSARRLLGGAMSSWVFGGMGSWNDTGPRDSDQYQRYEELTAALYDGVMDSLAAAANAYDSSIR